LRIEPAIEKKKIEERLLFFRVPHTEHFRCHLSLPISSL
jgi:hypothetical protein